MSAKLKAAWQKLTKQADEKLTVARMYFDDGALNSAARNFRQAGDLLEQAQAVRNSIFDDLASKPDLNIAKRHALPEHLRGLVGTDDEFLNRVELCIGSPGMTADKAQAKDKAGDDAG